MNEKEKFEENDFLKDTNNQVNKSTEKLEKQENENQKEFLEKKFNTSDSSRKNTADIKILLPDKSIVSLNTYFNSNADEIYTVIIIILLFEFTFILISI